MRACSKCGGSSTEDASHCVHCGQPLVAAGLSQNGSEKAVEDVSGYRKRYLDALSRMYESDRPISTWWAALNAFFVSGYLVLFLPIPLLWLNSDRLDVEYELYLILLAFARPILWAVFGLLLGLLFHRLLTRMNAHMAREERMRASAISYVRACASARGEESRMMNELLSLSAFDGQAMTYDKQISPRRWGLGISALFVFGSLGSIVLYLPILLFHYGWDSGFWLAYAVLGYASNFALLLAIVLSFYVASVLMKTTYTHDFRWASFSNSTVVALIKLGVQPHPGRPPSQLRERSFGKYAVLTVVTLGFFGFYWLRAMIADQNEHIENQIVFEHGLVERLGA